MKVNNSCSNETAQLVSAEMSHENIQEFLLGEIMKDKTISKILNNMGQVHSSDDIDENEDCKK